MKSYKQLVEETKGNMFSQMMDKAKSMYDDNKTTGNIGLALAGLTGVGALTGAIRGRLRNPRAYDKDETQSVASAKQTKDYETKLDMQSRKRSLLDRLSSFRQGRQDLGVSRRERIQVAPTKFQ